MDAKSEQKQPPAETTSPIEVIEPTVEPKNSTVGSPTFAPQIQQNFLFSNAAIPGEVLRPEYLRSLNDLVPGAAQRVLVMVEKQVAHRQEIENAYSLATSEDRKALRVLQGTGQASAIFVAFGAFVAACILAYLSAYTAAGIAVGTTLVSATTAFLRYSSPAKVDNQASESVTKNDRPTS